MAIDNPSGSDPGHGAEKKNGNVNEGLTPTPSLSTTASLPPIPDLPPRPPALDLSYVQDPDTRKLIEKEHARAMKSYEKAVKDREKAVQARAKLAEKRERNAQKEAEQASKNAKKAKQDAEADAERVKQSVGAEMTQEQKEKLRLETERQRMEAEARRLRGEKSPERDFDRGSVPLQTCQSISSDASLSLQPSSSPLASEASRSPSPRPHSTERQKPKKDRKFCTLPAKDSNGQRDPLWVRVFMENVDEVGAHCGLFFVDERYERLVGEVADRVEHWVLEDLDYQAVEGLSGDGEKR